VLTDVAVSPVAANMSRPRTDHGTDDHTAEWFAMP
jgi:hypothetical protein